MKFTKTMLDNHDQPCVLGYVLEALMEESEEQIEIRDDRKGLRLIYMKTVIDALDAMS